MIPIAHALNEAAIRNGREQACVAMVYESLRCLGDAFRFVNTMTCLTCVKNIRKSLFVTGKCESMLTGVGTFTDLCHGLSHVCYRAY